MKHMNAISGGQTTSSSILPIKNRPSRFQRLVNIFSYSPGATQSTRRQSKWFVRIGGALILTVTASVIASVSLADRVSASASARTLAANAKQNKMYPLSAREYAIEKAHAWRLYREAKRKCVALVPQPQTACVNQARTERRIRIADAKAQFEGGLPERSIGSIALR